MVSERGGWVLGLSSSGFLIKGLSSQPRPADPSGGRSARRQTQHVGLRAFRSCPPPARCGVASQGPGPGPGPGGWLALSGAWDEEAGVVSVALALSLSLRASGRPPGPGLGTAAVSLPPPPALATPQVVPGVDRRKHRLHETLTFSGKWLCIFYFSLTRV